MKKFQSCTLDYYFQNSTGRFLDSRLVFFRYAAGKYLLLDKLISLIPQHENYVEVFGGSGVILLNKAPAPKVEVYNDIQAHLVNLFRAIKRDPVILADLVSSIPWSREIFEKIVESYNRPLCHTHITTELEPDFVEAAKTFFLMRYSFGPKTPHEATKGNFAVSTRQFRAKYALSKFPIISKRLEDVLFENTSFENVIRRFDGENTFQYLDPPYFEPDQHQGGGIALNEKMHNDLFSILKSVKSKWLVTYDNSSYIYKLYSEAGFSCEVCPVTSYGARGAKKIEHLIIRNY
jgi:DNA adenine methylase